MNTSHRTYEWVTSHIWMHHIAHMTASRHTYDCVTSKVWFSPFTLMLASCRTNECIMWSIWCNKCALKWYVSFAKRLYKRDYVLQKRHQTFELVITYLNQSLMMFQVTHMNESRHSYWMHHVTHAITSCWIVICDAFAHMRMCDVSFAEYSIFFRALLQKRHITICDISQHIVLDTWMSHVTHMNASHRTYDCITSQIWMSHVTVIHAPWNHMSLLQKSPIKETMFCKRDIIH